MFPTWIHQIQRSMPSVSQANLVPFSARAQQILYNHNRVTMIGIHRSNTRMWFIYLTLVVVIFCAVEGTRVLGLALDPPSPRNNVSALLNSNLSGTFLSKNMLFSMKIRQEEECDVPGQSKCSSNFSSGRRI